MVLACIPSVSFSDEAQAPGPMTHLGRCWPSTLVVAANEQPNVAAAAVLGSASG
jgi:hypothetical protein